jgi:hypothetical protein
MRPGISICATCACLALSVPSASADWQYTKWGMTQSQVIAASKGEARKIEPGPNYVCNDDRIPFAAIESKSVGQFKFSVTFCSDKPGGPLKAVRLGYRDSVPFLKSQLLSQYGNPASDRGGDTIWVDQKSGNSVDLYDLGAGAILTYSSNKSGL